MNQTQTSGMYERYITERTDWEALFHQAIHNAIHWQNRCCDQQEIIELFCADADAEVRERERLKLHIKHIGNDALRTENHAQKASMRLALEELRFYRSCYGGSGKSIAAIAALEGIV